MIVVDANVLVYLLVETPQTPLAKRWAEAEPVWCFPELWRHEFASAIVSFVRAGQLDASHGEQVISEALRLFTPMQAPVDLVAAFRLSLRLKISPYDAQYVLLARSAGLRCLTADRQMLERAPRWTRSLGSIGDP